MILWGRALRSKSPSVHFRSKFQHILHSLSKRSYFWPKGQHPLFGHRHLLWLHCRLLDLWGNAQVSGTLPCLPKLSAPATLRMLPYKRISQSWGILFTFINLSTNNRNAHMKPSDWCLSMLPYSCFSVNFFLKKLYNWSISLSDMSWRNECLASVAVATLHDSFSSWHCQVADMHNGH